MGNNQLSEQILTFKLTEQSFGVCIKDVKEIIKSPSSISKFVGNTTFRGIMKHRNSTLGIIDLREKIENKKIDNILDTFIIVIEKNSKNCGFLVEKVEDIYQAKSDDFSDIPNLNNTVERESYVERILKKGDAIIPVLKLSEMM